MKRNFPWGHTLIAPTVLKHINQSLQNITSTDKEAFLNRFYQVDIEDILHRIDIASEREAMWLICECFEAYNTAKEDSIDKKVFSVLIAATKEIHLQRGGRLPTPTEIKQAHRLGRIMALNYFANRLAMEHQQ